jgi:hypothetical protein
MRHLNETRQKTGRRASFDMDLVVCLSEGAIYNDA